MLSRICNLSNPMADINAITTFTGFAHAKDVMLLSVASNKKMLQLLHYQEILGAHPPFHPKSLAVALSGFGSDATPVELDIEKMLVSLYLKMTPLWDALKLVGSDPDAFMGLIGFALYFSNRIVHLFHAIINCKLVPFLWCSLLHQSLLLLPKINFSIDGLEHGSQPLAGNTSTLRVSNKAGNLFSSYFTCWPIREPLVFPITVFI